MKNWDDKHFESLHAFTVKSLLEDIEKKNAVIAELVDAVRYLVLHNYDPVDVQYIEYMGLLNRIEGE